MARNQQILANVIMGEDKSEAKHIWCVVEGDVAGSSASFDDGVSGSVLSNAGTGAQDAIAAPRSADAPTSERCGPGGSREGVSPHALHVP